MESGEELSCIARGVFHSSAVRQLMDSFQTLLADVAADPTRNVSELATLDGQTRTEVLRRGRGAVEPLVAETLPAALGAQVRRAPDELAVRTRAASLTYAELDARSNRLALRLQALGIEPGARVGVSLESSADVVVAVFAAWKVGAAWVGLDARDADDRLAWIVRDASIEVIVGDESRGGLARHARVVAPAAGDHRAATASPAAAIGPDDVAVVYYGSGPSAIPHGIVLCHRSLLNLLAGLRRDVHRWPGGAGPTRRVCLSSPPTQDGFLRQLAALLDGHPLYVTDAPLRADPSGTVTLLAAGEIDLLDCTPAELEALLTAGLKEALAKRDGAIGPVLVLGTRAAPSPELWRAFRDLTALRGHVLYGPPECAFGATSRTTAGAPARPGVGRPMANVSSHVLDARGQAVPSRAVGELHLGGPSLFRDYLGDPKRSRERFIESALESGSGRLYRTGQRARALPDGHVELLGPEDAEPGLRGFRIEPARLRSALDGCPGVRDVTVAVRSGDRGEPRLVAYVVADGQPPTLAQLRAFLWSRLPGYACPSEIVVVPHLLPQGDGELATGFVPTAAPGHLPGKISPEQSVLTSLWAEVLGVERVGPEENYWQAFSFLEVLERARKVGLPVAGEQVTRNRTIEMLAADLAARRGRAEA
ncbi:MAG: AMP-binding protein [Actinomycetota bacterium]|nr:AMP-binding protein [Actinomycetota bacterium]